MNCKICRLSGWPLDYSEAQQKITTAIRELNQQFDFEIVEKEYTPEQSGVIFKQRCKKIEEEILSQYPSESVVPLPTTRKQWKDLQKRYGDAILVYVDTDGNVELNIFDIPLHGKH